MRRGDSVVEADIGDIAVEAATVGQQVDHPHRRAGPQPDRRPDLQLAVHQPAPDPGPTGNPQPVHTLLLIQNAIYLMESLDLESLASERLYEFLFVALPVKIRGATGSMVDPVAVV